MDLLDLKILKALQASGRKKNAELARELLIWISSVSWLKPASPLFPDSVNLRRF